jgi:hypothetical protein
MVSLEVFSGQLIQNKLHEKIRTSLKIKLPYIFEKKFIKRSLLAQVLININGNYPKTLALYQ